MIKVVGLLSLASLLVPSAFLAPVAGSQAQEARTVTVLVGAGQDQMQLLAFLPSRLRIRAGDTIEWKANGDEIHTASFTATLQVQPDGFAPPGGVPRELLQLTVPAPEDSGAEVMINPLMAFPTRADDAPTETYDGTSFVSSGLLGVRGSVPGGAMNEVFRVTFPAPGLYPYLCLIHVGGMMGTIEVVEAGTPDVPDQAAIDGQARGEAAGLTARLVRDRERGALVRSDPAPNGNTDWYVQAGWGFGSIHTFEFLPKDLSVRAGDTVTWASHYFHSITFNPTPPPPPWLLPGPQSDGPPLLLVNPAIRNPAKPSGTFNPRGYFNSADLGPFSVRGLSWSLTFDTPGTFEYICAIHGDLGMAGTITVVGR